VGRRLAFLITEDWYFRQHFLALAVAARDAGFEVTVCCRTGERGPDARDAIRDAGIGLREVPFDRAGLNPFADLATRREITRTYGELAPDIVHHVALKPVIHGQAAAREAGVAVRVNFLPGFGHVFTSDSLKARLLRPLVSAALSRALAGEDLGLMAMNDDDRHQLAGLAGTHPAHVTVLPGTGVDLDRFPEQPEPDGPVVATFLGRFLRDKGLVELAEAGRLLREWRAPVTIRLVGAPDPSNPASIRQRELERWRTECGLEILPWTDDVPGVWRDSHIAVLPSHREGFGMSLAEAAATGRALVATNAPGCREAVRDRETGLTVQSHDSIALAGVIETLARDGALRKRFAAAARADAENRLSLNRINAMVLALYDRLLQGK